MKIIRNVFFVVVLALVSMSAGILLGDMAGQYRALSGEASYRFVTAPDGSVTFSHVGGDASRNAGN